MIEALHFGKPMIVLPLFWDQYDNAQRVSETGFGLRLETYSFTDSDLTDAIESLLSDSALKARLATTSARIQKADGIKIGADVIEAVARKYRSNS